MLRKRFSKISLFGMQWRIQGVQFGANPPNLCGAPLPQMRPFLVPMEVETALKIP